jgi:hypothetical protein
MTRSWLYGRLPHGTAMWELANSTEVLPAFSELHAYDPVPMPVAGTRILSRGPSEIEAGYGRLALCVERGLSRAELDAVTA